MNLFMSYREYLFLGLSVVVLLMFGVKEYQINTLENELLVRDLEIEKYKTTLAHLEASVSVCNASIKMQNETIAVNEADIKKREEKLRELKSQPPDVRYKVIYKEIPKIDLKSNECDDIKAILDNIKESGI